MTTRPDVTDDAVVDFDHHSDEFDPNELAINADRRQKCPVAWNQNYDEIWFLSSYDAVSQTARHADTFSRPGAHVTSSSLCSRQRMATGSSNRS